MCIFRESEAEQRSPFRGHQFRHHIVLGQIHLIIIWLGLFPLVREPAGTLVFLEYRLSDHRHKGKLAIVVNPRTGLMRLLEAPDSGGRVHVLPSISHFPGLRSPEIHSPRAGNGRIGISSRKLISGLCTHQWIHIIGIVRGLAEKGYEQYHH